MTKKMIGIVTSCYNEQDNVEEFYRRIRNVFETALPAYDWNITFSENGSSDRTAECLRTLAAQDKRVRVIINTGNFGAVRSGFNALMAGKGDALINLCSDLQEPPEVIPELVRKWEEGFPIVCAVRKRNARRFSLLSLFRKLFYGLISRISETELVQNFTGFGLYDRKFIEVIREFHDSSPYFRGMIGEVAMRKAEVEYQEAPRKHGRSSYSLFSYYDFAVTGLINHSRLPLRLAVFSGLVLGLVSFLIALSYLIMKLVYWDQFSFGLAPLMIGMFFFGSIQLVFIGILGEYIGAIWTQVRRRPIVVEQERINFDPEDKRG